MAKSNVGDYYTVLKNQTVIDSDSDGPATLKEGIEVLVVKHYTSETYKIDYVFFVDLSTNKLLGTTEDQFEALFTFKEEKANVINF